MKAARWRWAPWLLLAPSLAWLALFFAYPMLRSFQLAFQDEAGAWGLASVRDTFADPRFTEAVVATLGLLVLIIPVQFALAMAMALVVNALRRGRDWWLYVYALPLAVSELAAGLVWFSIFTQAGWLNSVLDAFGLGPVTWLSYERPVLLIAAIVLAEAWRATAIVMVILVAGLQAIPPDLYEAADVHGATRWQRLRHVTLPLLRPSIRVALILRTVLAFQVFAIVVVLAGQGLTVLPAEAYRWYVTYENPNIAAVYAGVILVLSLAGAGAFFALLPTREEAQQ